jgi:hypothetical protein
MVHDIYGSIQLQGNEIRLLELFPGKSSEQMRCRLFIVSLDDSPVYEVRPVRILSEIRVDKPPARPYHMHGAVPLRLRCSMSMAMKTQ